MEKTVCFNLDKMLSRGKDSLTYDTGQNILKSIASEPNIRIFLYSKRARNPFGKYFVRREVKRILGSNDLRSIVIAGRKPEFLRAVDEDCMIYECAAAA